MSEKAMNGEKAFAVSDGIYRSACRMCHGGCGVLVHVRDGRVIKLQGDPESPFNKGKMCPKGLASIEQLYHPDRLKYPTKRVGKRGEGKWARISWDEALDLIAEKIREISSRYGREAVALGQGTGRYYFMSVLRFANALGTPNWCEPGNAQCFFPRVAAGIMTYGDLPVCDYYGETNPACLLVWGHNPTVSGADGEIQFRVKDCIRRGTKLIVIDPRKTEMAAKADIWLQVRPGADDALALAMLNVIIAECLYDKEFVDRWTVGFEALAERVGKYTPAAVEEITWVPAEKIVAAARLFASTKPAALEWGVALEHGPNALQTVRAVALLPALTGNIDVPGGWIFGSHLIGEPPLFAEALSEEMKEKRLGAAQFRVLAGPKAFFPAAHAPTLFRAIRTGQPYPVKAFLVFGNNALVTYANSKEMYETLAAVEFLTVMDLFMTPTAELADLVLPSVTWLEADEIAAMPLIANIAVLGQQKVVRVGEGRQPEEVLVELARRLDLPLGQEPIEQILDQHLEPLGITFEQLKAQGFVTAPVQYRKYEMTGFRTGSGKIELASGYMEMLGYDPLPDYEEPPESPTSSPELARDYPLVLTTGGRSPYFFCSEHRQIPSLRGRHPDPIVDLHPDTAKRRGIRDGDWVWIESPRGRIRQKARLTERIDPRVVNVEYGWWFPEEEGPEHGVWKANANVLTNNGPPYDPAMGTYQLRALLCRIYKE
jgi:thiosulfate reductase / polysulfide reductase chain A